MSCETLLCWESVNHGTLVLTGALEALAERGHRIGRVLLLVQEGRGAPPEGLLQGLRIEPVALPVPDPTDHAALYQTLRAKLLPRLSGIEED
ncbi:hypothetical protein LZ189_07065, partial [Rhodovulum sulfidophilum]|nr:hypothetical protein [Rhodovulum sulfidophilum]